LRRKNTQKLFYINDRELERSSDTASHTVFKGRAPCTAPHSLKLIYPLKIAGLEDECPFGARPIFRGENVSFREGNVFDWWWGPLLVLWNYWMFLLKRVYLLAYYHGWVQISVFSPR